MGSLGRYVVAVGTFGLQLGADNCLAMRGKASESASQRRAVLRREAVGSLLGMARCPRPHATARNVWLSYFRGDYSVVMEVGERFGLQGAVPGHERDGTARVEGGATTGYPGR